MLLRKRGVFAMIFWRNILTVYFERKTWSVKREIKFLAIFWRKFQLFSVIFYLKSWCSYLNMGKKNYIFAWFFLKKTWCFQRNILKQKKKLPWWFLTVIFEGTVRFLVWYLKNKKCDVLSEKMLKKLNVHSVWYCGQNFMFSAWYSEENNLWCFVTWYFDKKKG